MDNEKHLIIPYIYLNDKELTFVEAGAMAIIVNSDNRYFIKNTEIADKLRLSIRKVSRIIKKLEDKGYIKINTNIPKPLRDKKVKRIIRLSKREQSKLTDWLKAIFPNV
jgi:DNA-binding Lrp family transcriptional regulator